MYRGVWGYAGSAYGALAESSDLTGAGVTNLVVRARADDSSCTGYQDECNSSAEMHGHCARVMT